MAIAAEIASARPTATPCTGGRTFITDEGGWALRRQRQGPPSSRAMNARPLAVRARASKNLTFFF